MQIQTLTKLLFLILCVNGFDCVYVRTTSGLVKGTTVEVFGQELNQFLGIPFAEPPVGDLRFAKPKPLRKPIKVRVTGIANGGQQNPPFIGKMAKSPFWLDRQPYPRRQIVMEIFGGFLDFNLD